MNHRHFLDERWRSLRKTEPINPTNKPVSQVVHRATLIQLLQSFKAAKSIWLRPIIVVKLRKACAMLVMLRGTRPSATLTLGCSHLNYAWMPIWNFYCCWDDILTAVHLTNTPFQWTETTVTALQAVGSFLSRFARHDNCHWFPGCMKPAKESESLVTISHSLLIPASTASAKAKKHT